MMPTSVTTLEGDVMAWYEIIHAKRESFGADRDAEDLLRHVATALQTEDGPVGVEGLYGLTSNGARRSYFSLSPEAVARAERVLATYEARALTAPPELTGMEKIRRL
jgi:hypothetical protein